MEFVEGETSSISLSAPGILMVNLEDGGAVTTKIIDLGLAKAVIEPSAQTAISTPGAFAGTPEFASPEQFAGVQVDIRSDLYSLGVTLWEMLTGTTPFRGTPGEVMYQHQHSPLPLEQLEGIPRQSLFCLRCSLRKTPAALPEPSRTSQGDTDNNERYSRWAQNHS